MRLGRIGRDGEGTGKDGRGELEGAGRRRGPSRGGNG